MCRTRVLQLWSLLPDFMYNHPFDVAESFPRLAKILETAMKGIVEMTTIYTIIYI